MTNSESATLILGPPEPPNPNVNVAGEPPSEHGTKAPKVESMVAPTPDRMAVAMLSGR